MESTAKRISGTSGGVRVSNRPPHTPNTPTTSGIQPGMSNPSLSISPHSAHPGLPPLAHHGYYYPSHLPQDPADVYSHPWMSRISPPPRSGLGTPNPHSALLPLSPRNPSNQLRPGTLSPIPPGPLPSAPPHIHSRPNLNDIYSSLPASSITTAPPGPGGGGVGGTSRLNTGASTFFPRKVTIKSQDGRELDLSAWKKDVPVLPVAKNNTLSVHQTHQKRTSLIRMETIEAKEERLAKLREESSAKLEEKKAKLKEKKARKAEKKKAFEEKKRKEEEMKIEGEEQAGTVHIRKEERESVGEEKEVTEAAEEEGEIVEIPTFEEPPREVIEALSSPGTDTTKQKTRPCPPDLPSPTKKVVPALPYVLATAKMIENLGHSLYPEGITSPKPELNVDSKGRFRYDREFLLQFLAVCTEKPDVALDVIGLEAIGDRLHHPPTRAGHHRTSSTAMVLPIPQQASTPVFEPGTSSGFTIGQFSVPEKTTSNRTRSKRGAERNQLNKIRAGDLLDNETFTDLELVPPLEVSGNRWTREPPTDEEQDIGEMVKALLNELTMDEFDLISDQIIEWTNMSEADEDGRTLIRITGLVVEKASEDAARSEIYGRLCRRMMERISPNVHGCGILNTNGRPAVGGHLFRRYLLDRCQEDFERGLEANGGAAYATPGKGSEDVAVKRVAGAPGEVEFRSDECHITQKAKRQSYGLIQFVGELYKVKMLSGSIMHEYIEKFIGGVDNPEDEIESLCRLLTTIGKLLDSPKARAQMDLYFLRLEELGENCDVAPRVQFILQDLIELRERKWFPRDQVAAPTTITQVHEEAENGATKRTPTLEIVSKPSRPLNGGIRVDLGAGGTPEPQRRKLKLLPRSKLDEEENKGKTGSTHHSGGNGGDDAPQATSRAKANKKIPESEDFFAKLPLEHIPHREQQVAPRLCKPKHSKFYFGSGNVVFICEDTSFRVQSDLLSSNSKVFSGMLRPARLKGEHLSDGCPCVHLSDTAEDFATLLRVFYTSGFPHRHKTPDFTTFSSLLRMTTKYQLHEVRFQILLDLLLAYPTKLSEYEESSRLGEAVFGSPVPHPNSVLDLFVTCEVTFALPFAYYRASIAGDPASSDTSAREVALPSHILGTVLRGQARLKVDEVQLARKVAFEDCTGWGQCLRKSPAGRGLIFDWIHPEEVTQGGILERGDFQGSGHCSQCSQAFQQELSKAKKDTWENLPSYFSLPPWNNAAN